MRTPSTRPRGHRRGRPDRIYADHETGEPLEVVGRRAAAGPSRSQLPWAVENLRFCPWCHQLAQRDLNDCPTCGRRMPPLSRMRPRLAGGPLACAALRARRVRRHAGLRQRAGEFADAHADDRQHARQPRPDRHERHRRLDRGRPGSTTHDHHDHRAPPPPPRAATTTSSTASTTTRDVQRRTTNGGTAQTTTSSDDQLAPRPRRGQHHQRPASRAHLTAPCWRRRPA